MTSETATQTIQYLTRTADWTRQHAVREINRAIEDLQRALENVHKGRVATYYQQGIFNSSRVDVAVAQAALAQELLTNTSEMLAVMGE